MAKRPRIAKIVLDEQRAVRLSVQIEHERNVALFDLIEESHFAPVGATSGPFEVWLGVKDNRLLFEVHDQADGGKFRFTVWLASFRAIIRDYFVVTESYFQAIKTASPSRIEAMDVGRRSLHDEGGELLQRRLVGKAEVDSETARRLFTLICVLHIRG